MEMPTNRFQARVVVPTLVKGLEDMDELQLGQPVQPSSQRLEFGNHVLLLVFGHRSVLAAGCLSPRCKSLIWTCKSSSHCSGALPATIRARWSGYREWLEDKMIDVGFNKSSCVPVARDGAQDRHQNCL